MYIGCTCFIYSFLYHLFYSFHSRPKAHMSPFQKYLKDKKRKKQKRNEIFNLKTKTGKHLVKDSEEKRTSVVLFNLEESDMIAEQERKSHDLQKVKSIVSFLCDNVQVDSLTVKNVRRIGEYKNHIYTRPICVEFEKESDADFVFEERRNLENDDIWVDRYLSRTERGGIYQDLDDRFSRSENAVVFHHHVILRSEKIEIMNGLTANKKMIALINLAEVQTSCELEEREKDLEKVKNVLCYVCGDVNEEDVNNLTRANIRRIGNRKNIPDIPPRMLLIEMPMKANDKSGIHLVKVS